MFEVSDVIIYGTQGVCKIAEIEEKTVSGVKRSYYVLKPVSDKGATVFVPCDNAQVLKKMRRLLTKAEVDQLIDSMHREKAVWIDNENQRKELYKSMLSQGDHLELIKMLKAIYAHKVQREAEGKRLHISDDRFFRDAQQILYNEFQYVLDLKSKDDLIAYIESRMDSSQFL